MPGTADGHPFGTVGPAPRFCPFRLARGSVTYGTVADAPLRQDGRVTDEHLDPADMRKQYRSQLVAEESLADDPMGQFARWFRDAAEANVFEPNAMVVASATPDGRPARARSC